MGNYELKGKARPDNSVGSKHSILSSVLYLDYFLDRVSQIRKILEERKSLRDLAYIHSFLIAKHHGALTDFQTYLDSFASLNDTEGTVLGWHAQQWLKKWKEENENQKTEEHKQVEESKRTSWNKYLHGYQYQARVAYNIGGTAPIGLPATIRTLHSYTLQPNFSLGIDAYHPLSGKWGFVGGLHFENKGMKIDAGVKNYYMRIVRGGDELKGIFTGNVVTKVDMSLITVPLQATYDICDKPPFQVGSVC